MRADARRPQAAIAELHLHDPRDWEQITLLYGRLERLTGSPVVSMNRAVAVAEPGPERRFLDRRLAALG